MVRVKHRYLLVNFLYPEPLPSSKLQDGLPEHLQFYQPTPDDFHAGNLKSAIQKGVTELFGEYGVGMVSTGLKVNYLSNATSTAIIKCPRAHFRMVWAALSFMTKLPGKDGKPVVVKVVRVSGTIKKIEEEVIRRAKLTIKRAQMGDGIGGSVNGIVEAVQKWREDDVLVEVGEESESSESSESE
ncbi:Rpp14/Pop5 family-domain-containing protein [Clohesyomyces aquaticus]|uniref:Ribonuclease P/MRP protein subunit POP5 n=1 Tax=Clohesyomyces aquaticus TaxID=1231657 RepID=A0A1Y2A2K7_9PLEO|nr:Rpp14/Pop5 family-domain-containing protein [Clohesyomyces aquaticus]